MIATTERLILRRLTTRDAPWIVRLLNEPSFHENIGDKAVRTEAQAELYLLDGAIASYDDHGHGIYAVESRETHEPLGTCGLVRREALDHADLGYAFFPEHWGRGYAREAARAAVEHARDLAMPRLLAVVNDDNQPSIRLLEALGFERTGTVRLEESGPEIELYALDLAAGGSALSLQG